jgi:hypothetical protein
MNPVRTTTRRHSLTIWLTIAIGAAALATGCSSSQGQGSSEGNYEVISGINTKELSDVMGTAKSKLVGSVPASLCYKDDSPDASAGDEICASGVNQIFAINDPYGESAKTVMHNLVDLGWTNERGTSLHLSELDQAALEYPELQERPEFALMLVTPGLFGVTVVLHKQDLVLNMSILGKEMLQAPGPDEFHALRSELVGGFDLAKIGAALKADGFLVSVFIGKP